MTLGAEAESASPHSWQVLSLWSYIAFSLHFAFDLGKMIDPQAHSPVST